jgi:hypothetical protein
MSVTCEIEIRELAQRSNDGIDVTLLWSPQTSRLFVAVDDERAGDSFRFDVDAAHALDAFNHPFAYGKE